MKRLRIGVSTLTDTKLVAKCHYVETRLAANAALFPDPTPTVAELTAARLRAEQAMADAQDGGRIRTFQKNDALEQVRRKITLVSMYVNGIAQGDVELMVLGGFEPRPGNTPLGHLENPIGLKLTYTGRQGELKLRWKPRHGSRSYVVYMTSQNPSDPHSTWVRIGQPTRASWCVGGLQVGCVYSFAVSAIGAAGESGRSLPASLMAA